MINKDKNVILAITLNKETAEQLNIIVDDLSKSLNIALTKSQAIGLLINNYKQADKTAIKPKAKPTKKGLNYQGQILALKDKIGVSYPHLSNILDIPLSTLKKYVYGTQTPSAENEQKLLNALKRYGIK